MCPSLPRNCKVLLKVKGVLCSLFMSSSFPGCSSPPPILKQLTQVDCTCAPATKRLFLDLDFLGEVFFTGEREKKTHLGQSQPGVGERVLLEAGTVSEGEQNKQEAGLAVKLSSQTKSPTSNPCRKAQKMPASKPEGLKNSW